MARDIDDILEDIKDVSDQLKSGVGSTNTGRERLRKRNMDLMEEAQEAKGKALGSMGRSMRKQREELNQVTQSINRMRNNQSGPGAD